ncbi:metastasis-suppressor KiSS-1 [Ascaphus truei]|uniref:metastasis-suppressor KiSS-1 n=1 Tax=Ascaphus truei TaxID=8439 RepID=UPI003F59B9EC
MPPGRGADTMISPALSLLMLLVGVHLGESEKGPNQIPKFSGEEDSQWPGSLPCPEKMPAVWREEQTPVLARLCRRKKLPPLDQLWPSEPPLPSRDIHEPEGALLVERMKDLSTYNWNSFGLRYGKRAAGAVKAKMKIW